MKYYISTGYPQRASKEFIRENNTSLIIARHLESKTYQISLYKTQVRLVTQSGRLDQLTGHLEELKESHPEAVAAAVLEFYIEKGRLALPAKITW